MDVSERNISLSISDWCILELFVAVLYISRTPTITHWHGFTKQADHALLEAVFMTKYLEVNVGLQSFIHIFY